MSHVAFVPLGAAEQVCLVLVFVLSFAAVCPGRSAAYSPRLNVMRFAGFIGFDSGRCFPLRGECRSLAIRVRRYLSNLRR
jgi:hypothetical protein